MIRLKKSLLLVLILLVISMLAACHGSKYKGVDYDSIVDKSLDFTLPESFDTTKTYNIEFWSKNDSNRTQKETYEKAAREFHDLYPNINITVKVYTDYNKIYNDVITNIATSTTPNLAIAYPDNVATYKTGKNVVVSLDNIVSNAKYGLGGSELLFDSVSVSEISTKFYEEGKIKDKLYTLPFMRSSEACYINKTYVESLGYTVPDVLTWDFMFEVAEKAYQEKGTDATLIPIIYKSTDNMMIQMLKQLNAKYADEDGNIGLFNDTTKEILLNIASHTKGVFSTFSRSSYPGNFFNAGECIFAIDSTAGSTWIGSKAPLIEIPVEDLVDFETVVRPIPQYDVNNPLMISQGPSLCLFYKEDPQEVLASWLFMQYLLTDGIQIDYAKTEGYVPVTTRAQTAPSYLEYLSRRGEDNIDYYDIKIDASKLVLDYLENTFVTPVYNGSISLRNASGELIEEVVKGIYKQHTINDEYIDSIYEKVRGLYKLDQTVNVVSGSGVDILPKLSTMKPASKILLISLGSIWIIILGCIGFKYIKKKNHI